MHFPSIRISLVGFIVGETSVLYLDSRECYVFFIPPTVEILLIQ